MILLVGDGQYRTECDDCGASVVVDTDLQEVVVLRLIRAGWRIRHQSASWCPGCAGEAFDDEQPTLTRSRVL